MKSITGKINESLDLILASPKKAMWLGILAVCITGYAVTDLPFCNDDKNGSQANLSETDSLELAGQIVYQEEGCQYCHSQALRPFAWEVNRFSSAEKYGQFPLPDADEYRYQTPSLRGSFRIGPDLSRLAGKLTEEELTAYLKSRGGDTQAAEIHQFSRLFISDAGLSPLSLSWKLRMMMNSGLDISDPLQKSVFQRTADRTRGEALVAYLLSRGKNQMRFAGKFYANQ